MVLVIFGLFSIESAFLWLNVSSDLDKKKAMCRDYLSLEFPFHYISHCHMWFDSVRLHAHNRQKIGISIICIPFLRTCFLNESHPNYHQWNLFTHAFQFNRPWNIWMHEIRYWQIWWCGKECVFFSSHKQFRQKSKQHKIQRTQRYSIYGLNESNLQSQMRENSACRSLKRSFKVYALWLCF